MMRTVNWWHDDEPFRRALAARLNPAVLERAEPLLEEMGRLAPEFFAPRARLADRHPPALERGTTGPAAAWTGSRTTPPTRR